jgi:uncharacterized protein
VKIWIDLENSPHVPFFVPIIRELRDRGDEVIVTARDFAQTRGLVKNFGLDTNFIGREAGDNFVRKTAALLIRAVRLSSFLRGEKIDLAVSHGSRGLLLASKLLRIPSLILYDYEGANVKIFNRLATQVMTPAVIPFSKLASYGLTRSKHSVYQGLKEEVYVSDFTPDPAFAKVLRHEPDMILITVRPPSHTAHYKSDQSFTLFAGIMALLTSRHDVRVLFTPRSKRQAEEIRSAAWFNADRMTLIESPVSGLDLLYHSDLVIGGGGTMNREAAVLGVPVISIFKGDPGAVDEWLTQEGKLVSVNAAEEVIPFIRKREKTQAPGINSRVKEEILGLIRSMALNAR